MMTTLLSGLSVGSLYAIGAMLFTICLVRAGIFNFAQAHYVVVGNFVAYDLMVGLGWPVAVVIVVMALGGALLGTAQEVLTIRPTGGKGQGLLLATFGMAIGLEGFILVFWGTEPRRLPFFGGSEAVTVLGGRAQQFDLWLIVLAVLLAATFHHAVRHTAWGLLGRAVMADEVAAVLRGANIPRLRTYAFALAGSLAFAIGPLTASKMGVSHEVAFRLLIFSFAAGAVGGFGSFNGALVGGLLVGVLEALAARYLGIDWAGIVVFGLLATVLMTRPTGLLGLRRLRVV